ncbi:UPF0103-domain-containing protein [Morchella conica CCBAS932]|uniref:UPF0103-domain-containing protein n=1 Tax=Morchella conica CCBAS932 TaxID=1392247 RepID=A0A3N4KPI5_9PEZI|nr:UPF0103-domain-containing protein [Morchella conica CCBAS932]
MSTRRATHANSWYSGDKRTLNAELNEWLEAVGDEIEDAGPVPVSGARIIIAPHAGYSYSGPAAAYAYKSWDLSQAKRILILGPSHHVYLASCALPPATTATYATPLGPLTLDSATVSSLRATGKFQTMTMAVDEAEHSLEMHLPYVYKMLELAGRTGTPIIPIMVGSVGAAVEKEFGELLADLIGAEDVAVVVSTDFCHWGTRFDFTHYYPDLPEVPGPIPCSHPLPDPSSVKPSTYPPHQKLSSRVTPPADGPPIYESITALDKQGMAAVSTGSHDVFVEYLRKTKNTICGRHPIGVVMAGIESILEETDADETQGRFRWVRYEHSSEVEDVRDSSVSYASAFCIL